MRLPRIHGIIRRRLLINFRIDPAAAQKILPQPFRPKLQAGHAVGGICLIRLEEIRPKRFPRLLGISSENAAHRFAVTWEDDSGPREGVYIPRRDSGSLLNQLAGGRIFPGEHHRARFDVHDDGERVRLEMESADGTVSLRVDARTQSEWTKGSVFTSLEQASRFFEGGSLGYSATADGRKLDGIVLQTDRWEVQPLAVESVRSSYFEDRMLFSPGSAEFDCALIMRNISHEWHSAADLYS